MAVENRISSTNIVSYGNNTLVPTDFLRLLFVLTWNDRAE